MEVLLIGIHRFKIMNYVALGFKDMGIYSRNYVQAVTENNFGEMF
jgi:hypothetical protein